MLAAMYLLERCTLYISNLNYTYLLLHYKKVENSNAEIHIRGQFDDFEMEKNNNK